MEVAGFVVVGQDGHVSVTKALRVFPPPFASTTGIGRGHKPKETERFNIPLSFWHVDNLSGVSNRQFRQAVKYTLHAIEIIYPSTLAVWASLIKALWLAAYYLVSKFAVRVPVVVSRHDIGLGVVSRVACVTDTIMANATLTVTVEAMGVGCAVCIDRQLSRVFLSGTVRIVAIVRQEAMATLFLASRLTIETAADRARPTSSETLHPGSLHELRCSAKSSSSPYLFPDTTRAKAVANAGSRSDSCRQRNTSVASSGGHSIL